MGRSRGSRHDRAERPEKSPTVFNLGHTPEVAEKYPHVAKLSGGGDGASAGAGAKVEPGCTTICFWPTADWQLLRSIAGIAALNLTLLCPILAHLDCCVAAVLT